MTVSIRSEQVIFVSTNNCNDMSMKQSFRCVCTVINQRRIGILENEDLSTFGSVSSVPQATGYCM